MSVFLRSLIFISLIVSLLTMAVIKIGHYWQPFTYNTDIQHAPNVASNANTFNLLEEQQRYLETKEAELMHLQNEINEKIQVLQKAEQNILRLLQQNKEIAARLHQSDKKQFSETHDEEKIEAIEPDIDDEDKTLIIELDAEDE